MNIGLNTNHDDKNKLAIFIKIKLFTSVENKIAIDNILTRPANLTILSA